MMIDPKNVPPHDFYRHMLASITPRPIAWVSTLSPRGIANLAPFSFFNGVCGNPATILFCPTNDRNGKKKHTLINIESTPQFAVNIVPDRVAEAMNLTSSELEYEQSEFEFAKLTALPCERIKPPRVGESPVCMECEVMSVVPVGEGAMSGHVVIGRVVLMHVEEGVLDAQGEIDPGKLDTIGRMGGALYTRTRERFEMRR